MPSGFLSISFILKIIGRQAAQCMGRVVRSKRDYGVMIFADSRFNRAEKRNKLPPWIRKFMDMEGCLNLSVDDGVTKAKNFLKLMGQPINEESLSSILLSAEQIRERSGHSNHLQSNNIISSSNLIQQPSSTNNQPAISVLVKRKRNNEDIDENEEEEEEVEGENVKKKMKN